MDAKKTKENDDIGKAEVMQIAIGKKGFCL